MSKIAVVGSGIAGLACAWLLNRRHEVTLFEANRYLGGHANTVDATVDGITFPVDTGFLVYNDRTYPHLVRMFALLGVESAPSDMSFSVRIGDGSLEWAGNNLNAVFAQRRNLVNPRFLRMLADLLRFNREATALAKGGQPVAGTLGEFLDARGFGPEVRELYLIPMAACIWSTPATQINRFPMATFVQFCHNHGLLALTDRPQWRTVRRGSREYVAKLAADLHDVRIGCPVLAVSRRDKGVEVAAASGTERFDEVVLATHADQSLSLLQRPSHEERAVLKAIPYQRNRAVLHTDERLMPRRRRAWASWNFHAPRPKLSQEPVSLTYFLNRLQPLPFASPVLLTMNPVEEPRQERTLAEFEYHHPVFLESSSEAKRRVAALQGRAGIWFCGAWTRYGFHEDGLLSAVNVAQQMGIAVPWQA